ncbi:MAG: hypothetical protein NG740_00620 [Omnitrophica bacterium]|nr:hypothetical protein [Candidatus Omnitrophota bacterium]
MKKSVKIILREALVILGFLAVSVSILYVSLAHPPLPKPVTYTLPGKTRLDMPLAGYDAEDLVPDFITGAVYRRTEMDAVHKQRAGISGLAASIISIGYPLYLLLSLIMWMLKRFRNGKNKV